MDFRTSEVGMLAIRSGNSDRIHGEARELPSRKKRLSLPRTVVRHCPKIDDEYRSTNCVRHVAEPLTDCSAPHFLAFNDSVVL